MFQLTDHLFCCNPQFWIKMLKALYLYPRKGLMNPNLHNYGLFSVPKHNNYTQFSTSGQHEESFSEQMGLIFFN